ncbi:MAG: T9SS type A sorting domain-containing protein [Bacteroidales bacterium]|nr:T9SS type A sorting domain-containing protein [Bacteroidales bacterium]
MKTKNIFMLLISLSLIHLAFAQEFYEWQEPVMLTDASSDNFNPYISHLYASNDQKTIMAWEKIINENTTAVCMRELMEMTPVDTFLYEENVHYLNPEIMKPSWFFDGSEILYLLFYNKVESNTHSLNYITFYEDGTYSPPTPMASSTEDSLHFSVADGLGVSWNEGGGIYFSRVFNNGPKGIQLGSIDQLDSVNCSNPVLTNLFHCAWLKPNGNNLSIYSAEYNPWDQLWNDPVEVHTASEIKGFGGSTKAFMYDALFWFDHNEPYNRAFYYDLQYDEVIEVDKPYNTDKSYPTALDHPIMVTAFDIPQTLVSFVADSGNNPEIYANTYNGANEYVNISNDPGLDTKPELYIGETGGYWMKIHCVWESKNNGHSVLMGNYMKVMMGSTNENQSQHNDMSIHPNPMSNLTTIEYALKEKGEVSIQIYDQHGKLIDHLVNEEKAAGSHQVRWNGTSINGTPVPAGVYLVKIETKGITETEKLIINK